jgi:hypothetical protein
MTAVIYNFERSCESGPMDETERLFSALALQLPFCFEVRSLSGSLVSSAPE